VYEREALRAGAVKRASQTHLGAPPSQLRQLRETGTWEGPGFVPGCFMRLMRPPGAAHQDHGEEAAHQDHGAEAAHKGHGAEVEFCGVWATGRSWGSDLVRLPPRESPLRGGARGGRASTPRPRAPAETPANRLQVFVTIGVAEGVLLDLHISRARLRNSDSARGSGADGAPRGWAGVGALARGGGLVRGRGALRRAHGSEWVEVSELMDGGE